MCSYIVLGLPVLVMWPTNFCDNLLQTETRLWEIFILVMLSMRYKFLKRNSIQLLVLFNSYRYTIVCACYIGLYAPPNKQNILYNIQGRSQGYEHVYAQRQGYGFTELFWNGEGVDPP